MCHASCESSTRRPLQLTALSARVRQREAWEQGNAPPGFPNLRIEKKNPQFRSEVSDLTDLGRKQMGFDPFPASILEVLSPSILPVPRVLVPARGLFCRCCAGLRLDCGWVAVSTWEWKEWTLRACRNIDGVYAAGSFGRMETGCWRRRRQCSLSATRSSLLTSELLAVSFSRRAERHEPTRRPVMSQHANASSSMCQREQQRREPTGRPRTLRAKSSAARRGLRACLR